jgi:integrase
MSINLSQTRCKYYRVRFRVNPLLYPYFKKQYINKSFSTRDRKVAQLQATKLYIQYQHILQSIHFTTQEQTQILVNEFIKEYLNQEIMTRFTIEDTKYIAVTSEVTVKESYDKYCKWYKQQKVSDKQYMTTTNKLSKLILPYLGVDTNIEDITLDTIEEFQEFLTTFPNISRKQYKHLSFTELTNLNNVPDADVIGISTQIKYLKVVKQFFNYLIKADILRYNPCTLLTMPNNKIANRLPFTNNDMSSLFNIFDTLDDRKYIYYILAYTGMRPSELWKATISTEDGVVCFDLSDKYLKLKTQSSHRKIPLHNKLLELGVDKIFHQVTKQYTQTAVSIYFNKTIKPTITDNTNKIMYSFRHTVATELKRAEVMMDKVSEILGHNYENNSMTKEVYAGRYTVQQLQQTINQLQY